MKRRIKQLRLSRETLRTLNATQLQVAGANPIDTGRSVCFGCETAVSYCQECYTHEQALPCYNPD